MLHQEQYHLYGWKENTLFVIILKENYILFFGPQIQNSSENINFISSNGTYNTFEILSDTNHLDRPK